MDFTGVTDLHLLSTDNLDILFVGDHHSMYDPYRDNSMHNWIDTKITQKSNSYVLAESTKIDSQICFPMQLMPRYFKYNHVYFRDNIRFAFKCEKYAEKITAQVSKFILEVRNSTDILKLPSPFKNNEDNKPITTNKEETIAFSEKIPRYREDHIYNKNDVSTKRISTINMLFNYESMILHYMHNSLIYRVVNWIKDYYKKDNLPADCELWKLINKWVVNEDFSYSTVVAFSHLLDIPIITKVLDLSRKHAAEKILIWIVAGSGHTGIVYAFLSKLFEFIGNTFKQHISRYADLTKSDEMLKMITAFPQLGLRKPEPYVEKIYMTGDKLFELMKSMEFLEATPESKAEATPESLDKPQTSVKNEQIKIKTFVDAVLNDKFTEMYPSTINHLPNIKAYLKCLKDIKIVIKVIELMQDKQIVKNFLPEELNNLLATPCLFTNSETYPLASIIVTSQYKTFISGSGGSYGPNRYLMFCDQLKCIFIPCFNFNEKYHIENKSVTIKSYIGEKNNVLFRDLIKGDSILGISTNSGKVYESTISNTIETKYAIFIDTFQKITGSQKTVIKIIENIKNKINPLIVDRELVQKGYLNFDSCIEEAELKKYIRPILTKEAELLDPDITHYKNMWDKHLRELAEKFVGADKNLVLYAHKKTLEEYDEFPDTQDEGKEREEKLGDEAIKHIELTFVSYVEAYKSKYVINQINSKLYRDIPEDIIQSIYDDIVISTLCSDIDTRDMTNPDKIKEYFTLPTDDEIIRVTDNLLHDIVSFNKQQKEYYIEEIVDTNARAVKDNEYFTLERLICEIEKYMENRQSDSESDGDGYYGGAETTCKWLDVLLLAILICVFLYLFYQICCFIVGNKFTSKKHASYAYQAV